MINALLTGRGNNTLKDKNILPVLGKPLLSYAAMAAKNVREIDKFFVSSEDEKILNIACDLGFKKIKRPKSLAKPNSKHIDAIKHALNFMQKRACEPDILVVLLANSATIKSLWIQKAIHLILNDENISAVVPVYNEQDHHPFRAKRLDENGSLQAFFDFKDRQISTNRQDLEKCYFLCHNFWVLNLKKSLYAKGGQQPWEFLGNNIKPIFTQDCFDVHSLEDIKKTELWLRKNGGN